MSKKLYAEYTVDYISGCMSLRPPQKQSLKILHDILERIPLKKEQDLPTALKAIHDTYPICTDFEREFMSLTFALATGVGKTRLMGAFVTYLYAQKGVKNFFIVAPNLTIYNKLIAEFGNSNHPKYVFKGIGAFHNFPPNIITGESYQSKGTQYGMNEVNINIFNIAKFNRELQNIRKLSEFLGESYFQYLAGQSDLCILMDESHHYRADKGAKALNELKAVLGLELTATPQIEEGNKTVKFKNVVYEYSLANALRDGFVKTPYALTRKDIAKRNFTDEEMDKAKLIDGIARHESTKVKLELYARNNQLKIVKPFTLVVCKDTDHAEWVNTYICSTAFYGGRYKDKVLIIHSNQRGAEKDENIAKLLEVEDYNNSIEIVIHVNILKEGWDVTNLYTIIPLRTAASKTLREQTIGRGLRLPYGKRTDDKDVDALTIVAHDKFEEIVREANDPNSLLRKENVIFAEDLDNTPKEVETVLSVQEEATQLIITQTIEGLQSVGKELTHEEQNVLINTGNLISSVISSYANEVGSIENISSESAKREIKKRVEADLPEQKIEFVSTDFTDILGKFISQTIQTQTELVSKNMIEIPRLTIMRDTKAKHYFEDFDLDTSRFHYVPLSGATMLQNLTNNEVEEYTDKGVLVMGDTPENTLVSLIIDRPEIDYDICSDLLYKLVGQAIAKIKSGYSKDEFLNIIQNHKANIAERIYLQMMQHFKAADAKLIVSLARNYSDILPHNYEKNKDEPIRSIYQGAGEGSIRSKLFNGFKKAAHSMYKFDSRDELNFAVICETNKEVLKWMRPHEKQFNIYYGTLHNHKYEPDFVVETSEIIYLVEIKDMRQVDDPTVRQKSEAANKFCEHATFYNQKKKKSWVYLIIPSGSFSTTSSFDGLAKQYEYKA